MGIVLQTKQESKLKLAAESVTLMGGLKYEFSLLRLLLGGTP